MRHLFMIGFAIVLLAACGGGNEPSDATQTTALPAATSAISLAAEVNGQPIPLSALEREIEIYLVSSGSQPANRDALLGTLLEGMIEQVLVEQAAAEMGIAISDEQVQAEIDTLKAYAAEQGTTIEAFFAMQGYTAEEYPGIVRYTLVQSAVNAQVVASVPGTVDQVHARHILVADIATARLILDQLSQGADFAALALQYSLDPTSRDAGGDLGWIAPGDLIQPEVEAAIFALPANSRAPEPVQSVLGFHIIESIERTEGLPADPAQIAELRKQVWTNWLNQRRNAATIRRFVGPNASG